MKAILINTGGKVLGEVMVDKNCIVLEYGGSLFVSAHLSLVEPGNPAMMFTETLKYVRGKLDKEYL